MNNQNTSNMPDYHNNNHAAIHEDIYLQTQREGNRIPDTLEEESEGLPHTINGMINGHGPYDYI